MEQDMIYWWQQYDVFVIFISLIGVIGIWLFIKLLHYLTGLTFRSFIFFCWPKNDSIIRKLLRARRRLKKYYDRDHKFEYRYFDEELIQQIDIRITDMRGMKDNKNRIILWRALRAKKAIENYFMSDSIRGKYSNEKWKDGFYRRHKELLEEERELQYAKCSERRKKRTEKIKVWYKEIKNYLEQKQEELSCVSESGIIKDQPIACSMNNQLEEVIHRINHHTSIESQKTRTLLSSNSLATRRRQFSLFFVNMGFKGLNVVKAIYLIIFS